MRPLLTLMILMSAMIPGEVLADSYSISYGKNMVIDNCTLESITDSTLTIRYYPDAPRLVQTKTLQLTSLKVIRVRSSANVNSPCLGIIGGFAGLMVSAGFVQSDSNGDSNFLEAVLSKIEIVAIGGIVGTLFGYYGSHILLGGNNEKIVLDGQKPIDIKSTLETLKSRKST